MEHRQYTYTFAEIERFLKISKSAKRDEGPYTVTREPGSDWYLICNLVGTIVAQVSADDISMMGRSRLFANAASADLQVLADLMRLQSPEGAARVDAARDELERLQRIINDAADYLKPWLPSPFHPAIAAILMAHSAVEPQPQQPNIPDIVEDVQR
jgi:hypothetical protein